MTIAEIRKDIKKFKTPVKHVYLLNTGDYMATTDSNSIEVRIANEKYGAVDITNQVLEESK